MSAVNEENVLFEMTSEISDEVLEESDLNVDGQELLVDDEDYSSSNEITDVCEQTVVEEPELDELTTLKAEVESLRAQLKAREDEERAVTRIHSELVEFEEYFPEVELSSIPDDVWEKVKSGASLSASYSLFKRKEELKNKKICDINEKNRKMSAGSVIGGEGEKFFSPAEVKRMTPAQVKTNYDGIVESMRHWN